VLGLDEDLTPGDLADGDLGLGDLGDFGDFGNFASDDSVPGSVSRAAGVYTPSNAGFM